MICRGYIHDITKHKRQKMLQRESELCYHEIFDNTSDHIFLLDVTDDRRFRLAAVNPAFEKAHARPRESLIGKYIEEITTKTCAEALLTHYRRCVEIGAAEEYESVVELKTGRYVFRTTLIPIHNANGRVHRIAGITCDITQQKELEEELQRRESEFRELVENSPASSSTAMTETAIVCMRIPNW